MTRNLFFTMMFLFVFATCAFAATPMTVEEFHKKCNSSMQQGDSKKNCGVISDICKSYENVVSDKYADQAKCIAKCSAVMDKLSPLHVADNCSDLVANSNSVCFDFCKSNYTK